MDNMPAVTSSGPLQSGLTVGSIETVQLLTLPTCFKVNLRGDATDVDFAAAIEKTTGLPLPLRSNTKTSNEQASLLWLGPDEWQWRCNNIADDELDNGSTAAMLDDLKSGLSGIHSAVVDVSDYYALMSLRGPRVFDVLEKGTPLNLLVSLSHVDQCAQTRFGNAAVLLDYCAAAEHSVQIQVRWSYAEYLWFYLSDAMLEFGGTNS